MFLSLMPFSPRAMNETNSAATLASYVARVRHLYTLPAVAAEVLRLTSEPTVDARSIKLCLENDPALTTRILRVVNSSLFGLSRQVTDLNQALALLGVKPLKMLVLGFSLPRNLQSSVDAQVLARYWKHSLLKAIASRELATRVFRISGDEAFLAGLLQDVGMLAMVQDLGESFTRFLDHVAQHGGNLLDLELDALGFDHLVVSSRLLDSWGLPETMTTAIAARPDCEPILRLSGPAKPIAMTLHLAELLVRMTEQPYGSALHELLFAGKAYGGISLETVQAIAQVMDERIGELASVLNLELPSGKTTSELLIAAHAALSDVAAEASREMIATGVEEQLLESTLALREQIATSARSTSSSAVAASSGTVTTAAASLPHSVARESRSSNTSNFDPGLAGLVTSAIAQARNSRVPVSLAFVEIDRATDLCYTLGTSAAAGLMHEVGLALYEAVHGEGRVIEIASARWAVVLLDYQRSAATSVLRQLQSQWKRKSESADRGEKSSVATASISLSIGIATLALPSKNFPSEQLLAAADRCLTGAMLSGGDTIKTIEF